MNSAIFKTNSAVSEALIPKFIFLFAGFKSGVPLSTTKAVMPRESSNSCSRKNYCNISAFSIWWSVLCSIQDPKSPSCFATQRILKASLPVLASVSPHAPIHSPVEACSGIFVFVRHFQMPWYDLYTRIVSGHRKSDGTTHLRYPTIAVMYSK